MFLKMLDERIRLSILGDLQMSGCTGQYSLVGTSLKINTKKTVFKYVPH